MPSSCVNPAHHSLSCCLLDKCGCLLEDPTVLSADVWSKEGNALYARSLAEEGEQEQRLLDAAELALALALKADGHCGDAYSDYGLVLQQRGLMEEAIDAHERAVLCDCTNPRFHFNLGLALGDFGDDDRAIGCFDRTLALDPFYTDAWFNKGCFYLGKSCLNQAVACFAKAIELHPQYPGKEPARAHAYLARALLKKGMIPQAITHYSQSLDLDSSSIEAHFSLVKSLMIKGDANAAILAHHHAVTLCGEEYSARCANCCKPHATKCCAKCKCVRYCSRECQVADWKASSGFSFCGLKHRQVCKGMAAAAAARQEAAELESAASSAWAS